MLFALLIASVSVVPGKIQPALDTPPGLEMRLGGFVSERLRANLAKIIAVTLAVYFVVRVEDLLTRGAWRELTALTYYSLAFYAELLIGFVIPFAMLLFAAGMTLIDFDTIEAKNLNRILNATEADAARDILKVDMFADPDRLQERHRFDRSCNDLSSRMFLSRHRGGHVDPGHDDPAEGDPVVVGMLGHEHVMRLHLAVPGRFRLDRIHLRPPGH